VAKDISKLMGQSRNQIYLDSDSLLLNLTLPLDKNLEKTYFMPEAPAR